MTWISRIINLIKSLFVKEIEPDKFTVPDPKTFDESRIVMDYSVTEKWHRGWKRPLAQITEAVVHHTGGNGTIEGLKNWMLKGERSKSYKRGIALFHFAVDKDGKIWKLGPISRWWYHSTSGKHDRFTVGIELIHYKGPLSVNQYKSLYWLLFDYLPHFCENYNRIVSHDYNSNTYSGTKKGCPGPDFKWESLTKEMDKRKIAYNTSGFEEYTLTFPV